MNTQAMISGVAFLPQQPPAPPTSGETLAGRLLLTMEQLTQCEKHLAEIALKLSGPSVNAQQDRPSATSIAGYVQDIHARCSMIHGALEALNASLA